MYFSQDCQDLNYLFRNKIPKILFQTNKVKNPDYVTKLFNKTLSSDWTYVHFTDNQILDFFNNNHLEEFPDAMNRFNSINLMPCKICFFRLYFLYINGGVFLDSDALFTHSVDEIIQDYSFISVKSTCVDGTLFNGLIGAEPKNLIIYKALKYAYETDINLINNNYFYSCRNLYDIIFNQNNTFDFKYKLYDETIYNGDFDCGAVYDQKKLIAIHYWKHKIIPNYTDDEFKNL